MAWQLWNLQAHLSVYSGDLLHREITTCTDSRIKTINQWAGAHASVTAILSEAPSGSILILQPQPRGYSTRPPHATSRSGTSETSGGTLSAYSGDV